MNLTAFLLVFLGGGLGASLRFFISHFVNGSSFYAVLIPNLLGCALIGVASQVLGAQENLKLLFIVGLLGGFTTFSSYMLFLGEEGLSGQSALFFLLHNMLGFALFFLGSKISLAFI